ncbi:MAG: exodeoxyribonuclease VII large subunit [Planctomycetota bacterium]
MSNTVELARDGVNLEIRFGYRPDLVALVKELPERRFDGRSKTWSVPARHAEVVYDKLSRHLFEFAPEVMSIVAGTMGKPKATPAIRDGGPIGDETAPDERAPADDSLTISAFNARVRDCLLAGFAQKLWITGEVVDFDKGANKSHKFFALVEKDAGEAMPRARVDAVMWETSATTIFRRLREQAPDFAMRDGIEIRVQVRVDFYVKSGRFQVVVEDVDPSFTLGKLALNREQILRQLRERALFDRNRELPLPIPPLRVGVLTSESADGWNDFLRHLEQSEVGFELTLVPVQVQGENVRTTVLAGLRWFAAHATSFDCICIVRGGGSRTDLAWFDDLEIAIAVAQHPLKVLIGIGHERDRSVLDEIAHSEKTPTALAGFLAATVVDERRRNADRAIALQRNVGRTLASARSALDSATKALRLVANARVAHERHRLSVAATGICRDALRTLTAGRRSLEQTARSLQFSAVQACERARQTLVHGSDRARLGTDNLLRRAGERLDGRTTRLRLLDPTTVLRRGFALVRDGDGRVLPSASRVATGQQLHIQLRDGTVHTRAESIETNP